MLLGNHKWEKVKLGEVCLITSGGTPNTRIQEYWIDGTIPWLRSECCKDEKVLEANEYISEVGLKNSSAKLFKSGTTLIALVGATIGKTAYIPFEATTNQNVASLFPINENKVFKEFLFYACQNAYKEYFSGISGFKMANLSFIKQIEIPLPSLSEQSQIAELFQSIEIAIEQAEHQEKNLRKLCKKMIDDFVSDKPSFGNLLKGKQLKKVNYCDVTEKLMRKIDPVSYGIDRIVGGENLESEDFGIRTWSTVGKDFLGPAFHVLFKPGDILYGSRRTYLRKVALADFEGVCANTTYVIRADEKILLQDLLKHIMLSERFTQYSIGVSKGSTNPYINWKDLDNFSFQIPDIKIQKEIVRILDEIIELAEKSRERKQALKNLKQKLLNEILG